MRTVRARLVLLFWAMTWTMPPILGQALGPGDPFDAARPAVMATRGDSVLAGATIFQIMLDRRGHLWAATQDGVFRLEGRDWKPLALPKGLLSFHVRCLLEGADGALWLGMESSGLLRYQDGKWTVWDKTKGLPVNRINHLLEVTDASGKKEIWAATAGGGVLRQRQGAWEPFGKDAGPLGSWVWRLREIQAEDGTREIWAATGTGIQIHRDGIWKALPDKPGRPTEQVNDILQVSSAPGKMEIWVSCWGRGLVRWDGQAWSEFGKRQGFPSRNPTSLAVTPGTSGRPLLWVSTYDTGLLAYDGKGWRHFQPGRELPSTGVYTTCPNPSGRPTLWIGSRGLGLLSLDLGGWRLVDEQEGLPNAEVNCFAGYLAPNGERSFWVGTGYGLLRWESSGRRVAETPKTGFPATRVNVLLSTSSRGGHDLWAGTISGLAHQRNKGPWHLLGPKEGLPAAQVFALLETAAPSKERTLWAGTEVGLARLQQGRWTLFTTKDGLRTNWINALAQTQDPDGSTVLWAASRGGGLSCLRDGQWVRMDQGLSNLDINSLKPVRSKDGRQWLWAGSGGGGLARLEAGKPGARWEMFDTEAFGSLRSRFFFRLEMDQEGRLYASTTRGIYRFLVEEVNGVPTPRQVENFTLGDGLPNLSGVWFPSSYIDHLGRVWFGTPKGAVVLDPSLERPDPPPQAPYLLSFTRGGEPLPYTRDMAFRQRQQREVFEFVQTGFHRPEDTRYCSQLVGLETSPGPWYPEGRRELTGIAPGSYVLKVWARDFQGRVSPPLELPFRINPPLWRSPWALAVYAVLAWALLLLLYRLRVYFLQQRNRELEHLVAQRTTELATSNQSLLALNDKHATVIEDLRATLAEVRTLRGLIPICMHCKKIRDDSGFWNQLEAYISVHSEARFSHGYCPECAAEAKKQFAEHAKQRDKIDG